MKVQLWKGQDGNVLSKTAHNNRAPGLLRIFITDYRVTGATEKMADIKKNADFVKVIAEYLQKPVESIVLRFNTNLMVDTDGTKYAGILVQDALNKFQNANAPEVDVDIFSDDQDIDTVLAAEEAAIAEVPETQIAPADEATAEVNENTPPELA
jgi:hypothetical protein